MRGYPHKNRIVQAGQQRIAPQLIVIVHVFIAEAQAELALLDEVWNGELDEVGIAEVVEALDEFQ